jgi:hypothetical protein
MRKELLIIFLLLLIGIGFVLYYSLFKPSGTLKYNGLQIYDAVKEYDFLSSHGFDINVTVWGNDYSGNIKLNGKIIEAEGGLFVLQINDSHYRVIEGIMGTEDVQAKEIYFYVAKPMVVEVIKSPIKSFVEFSDLLEDYEKVKGEFAVVTNESITPLVIQKLRNLGGSFYNIPNIEVEQYTNGFIVNIRNPIEANGLLEILNLVNKELYIEKFESNYLFLYKGIENENEAIRIKENAGGLVRTYKI